MLLFVFALLSRYVVGLFCFALFVIILLLLLDAFCLYISLCDEITYVYCFCIFCSVLIVFFCLF